VRENEPWVSSSAAGALAVFYTSAQTHIEWKGVTIVKLAFPFSLIVTGSVTSSSPFKSSKRRWACFGWMAEPDVVSIAVNVNLRVPPSASSIALGRGASSFNLRVSVVQEQEGSSSHRTAHLGIDDKG
jgi:hypothetical protein